MTSLVFIVVFVLCAAIVVAAVLIGHELVNTYDSAFCRHYFYYLAAFFAFAVYGIWGQIVVRALLATGIGTDAIEIDAIELFVNVVPALGVPFLFVSWLMLINMAHALRGAGSATRWALAHAAVFVTLVLCAWIAFLYLDLEPAAASLPALELAVLAGLELLYLAAALAIAARATLPDEHRRTFAVFAALFAGGFAIRQTLLGTALAFEWLVPIAVLVYFGSNLLPLLFLRTQADRVFEPVSADQAASDDDLARLFERHGITRREREIAREICLGKTNQQIADGLFISLQTVKDHTHRIYSKMGVRSRVQLVQKLTR
jgi:DNA-binding CsgD family transcriptional regulator